MRHCFLCAIVGLLGLLSACGGEQETELPPALTPTVESPTATDGTPTPAARAQLGEARYLLLSEGWLEDVQGILDTLQPVETEGGRVQLNPNFDPAAAALDIEDLLAEIEAQIPPLRYEEAHRLWLRLMDELAAAVEARRLGDTEREDLHGENVVEILERLLAELGAGQ